MTKKHWILTAFILGATIAVVGGVVAAKKVGMICSEDEVCEN